MKSFLKNVSLLLAVTVILASAGCSKGSSGGSSVSSDTTAAVETSETTEASETSDASGSEETSATAATSGSETSADNGDVLTIDGMLSGATDSGVRIYDDYSTFLDDYNKLFAGDQQTVEDYKNGFGIRINGHDKAMQMVKDIGDGSNRDDDFLAHLSELGYIMAGDLDTKAYTVVVLVYKMDDEQTGNGWYDSSVDDFEKDMAEYRDTKDIDLKTKRLEENGTKSFLYKYTINNDAAQAQGYPADSGTFGGVYISGDKCMFATVVDLDADHRGIAIMRSVCNSMGVKNPFDDI